ncbi:hypothetical protein KGD83_18115 [Nocardiopsis akebiae]|uniref:HEAT repeat domain-containing protein n=1 Tax=Nocardiopsis akebiae TaxID=2831968 RepID=A0ABX8BZV5_9ACTN|nr:hypothetical protein [Nocardiopsis akebiae]QUX27235.1 hypothetical protein KGD83_18115 [Nocardiopsis akebiae]
MQTGPDVLHTTDWTRTFHAYGSGADAPGHLAALLTGDARERGRALDHLRSALLHQGTVYPATVPAALFVAGILDRPELDGPARAPLPEASGEDRGSPRRVLLGFLAAAAEGALYQTPSGPVAEPPTGAELDRVYAALASDDEEEAVGVWETPAVDALMGRAGPEMRAAAPVLYAAVEPHLTASDAHTRMCAVEAAAALARLGGLEPDLSGAADMAETRDEGAVIVLALGACGADTTEFLAHADPAIRACAALAPGQRANPVAAAELAAALADPEAADAWFTRRPSHFTGHVRFALVRELAERSTAEDAARLLPVLRALAPLASPLTAAADAGPLLDLAFRSADPAGLTAVQRDYLRVLADHDGFWDGRFANFLVVLARLGLPRERHGLRALLAA